jgi:hypothetical protein
VSREAPLLMPCSATTWTSRTLTILSCGVGTAPSWPPSALEGHQGRHIMLTAKEDYGAFLREHAGLLALYTG